MDLFQAGILGLIQGITEWLPVSSSGHLVIAQEFMSLQVPVLFDVMLHFGTLCAVCLAMRDELWKMLCSLLKLKFDSYYGKLFLFIVLGSIPTALIGFAFHDLFEGFFSNLFAVGVALLITGTVLFLSKKFEGRRKLGAVDALLIGVAQGIAIIPGISRSGSTISVALFRGIEKEKAAKFSFLLSMPAIIGAALFEAKEINLNQAELGPLVFGVLISFVVGYASVNLLLDVVLKKKFYLFSYYCWVVGLLILFVALF